MAATTQEISITYAGVTIGGSSGRKITEYTRNGDAYETGWVEFEFITRAATAAAWKTELDTIRAAFRTPRGDLVVTSESQTILSLKQSNNTGLDAQPEIIKDGDLADTGRSRHFRVRIEFGRPADNVSTDFRRYSTVKVEYAPTRQRTVTISGVYTANSTDGTTGSFAQYRAQIDAYASTVLTGISGSATFERIGEPDVTRNETDKVTNFTAVYKEIIFQQASGTTDVNWIVDPRLDISVERTSPGDSPGGRLVVVGGGGGTQTLPAGTGSDDIGRPVEVTLSYTCFVDNTIVTPNQVPSKYKTVLRSFLIAQAVAALNGFTTGFAVLVMEKPGYDKYTNQLHVEMKLIGYFNNLTRLRVTVTDDTDYARQLVGAYSSNAAEFYDFPGPLVRLRTIEEEYQQRISPTDIGKFVDGLVKAPGSVAFGYGANWVIARRYPKAFIEKQGLPGHGTEYLATCIVVTVLRYRILLTKATAASAGGITGVGLTT